MSNCDFCENKIDFQQETHFIYKTCSISLSKHVRCSCSAFDSKELIEILKSQSEKELNAIVQYNPNISKDIENLSLIDVRNAPFYGIPFTIKEHIAVEGLFQTYGTKKFQNNVAKEDSTIVKRLKQAGALILGTTNISEYGVSYDTHNKIYGSTKNPHNMLLSAGGSSGGEAAALASGQSLIGIGGDVGGGIRLSAAFCGLLGLRPSHGRVPQTGVGPGTSFLKKNFTAQIATYGPMGYHVDDLEQTLRVISGPDFHDPFCHQQYTADSRLVECETLRVAIVPPSLRGLGAASLLALQKARKRLESSGIEVVEAMPRGFDDALTLARRLWGHDGGVGLKQALACDESEFNDGVRWHFDFIGEEHVVDTPHDVLQLIADFQTYQSNYIEFFRDFDAIVTPVTDSGVPLQPKDCHNFGNIRHTIAVSLARVPAGVVGTLGAKRKCLQLDDDDDEHELPLSVQIVAAPCREDIVLALMRVIHDENQ